LSGRAVLVAFVAGLATGSCGGVVCGDGTTEINGTCVADNPPYYSCDEILQCPPGTMPIEGDRMCFCVATPQPDAGSGDLGTDAPLDAGVDAAAGWDSLTDTSSDGSRDALPDVASDAAADAGAPDVAVDAAPDGDGGPDASPDGPIDADAGPDASADVASG
jgi:hypothetical protein